LETEFHQLNIISPNSFSGYFIDIKLIEKRAIEQKGAKLVEIITGQKKHIHFFRREIALLLEKLMQGQLFETFAHLIVVIDTLIGQPFADFPPLS
jgi:hypothetical protein